MGCEGSKPAARGPAPPLRAHSSAHPHHRAASASASAGLRTASATESSSLSSERTSATKTIDGYSADSSVGPADTASSNVSSDRAPSADCCGDCRTCDASADLIAQPISIAAQHKPASGASATFFEVHPSCAQGTHVAGTLALSAFPSKKAVKGLKKSGCDLIVTLQKDEEGAQKVGKMCGQTGIEWMQVDFWHLYHRKMSDELFAKVEEVAQRIRKGDSVMIHCAAGIHRTGMFAYSVLLALGYSPKAAVKSIRTLRSHCHARVGAHRVLGVHELLCPHFPNPSAKLDISLLPVVPEAAAGLKAL